ncbi:MAG: hypothetical protein LBE91_09080 [Tannerella sp.]|jgi:hypothetical protein|nr:hypothetical protein [Tannerella sp.]
MKTIKLFLFMFAIIFVCEHTRAQDNDLPYRPFKLFHNDTIRYLDYNFTIRSDQYVNKPAGAFFNDLELPIVYVSYLLFAPKGGSEVDIFGMNLVLHKVGDGGNEFDYSKDYYIEIRLSPVTDEDFAKALYTDERNKEPLPYYYWTPQLRELLKDYVIKSISSNDKLFQERREILENTQTYKELVERLSKVMEVEKTKWRKINRAEKQRINQVK